ARLSRGSSHSPTSASACNTPGTRDSAAWSPTWTVQAGGHRTTTHCTCTHGWCSRRSADAAARLLLSAWRPRHEAGPHGAGLCWAAALPIALFKALADARFASVAALGVVWHRSAGVHRGLSECGRLSRVPARID